MAAINGAAAQGPNVDAVLRQREAEAAKPAQSTEPQSAQWLKGYPATIAQMAQQVDIKGIGVTGLALPEHFLGKAVIAPAAKEETTKEAREKSADEKSEAAERRDDADNEDI